MWIYQFAIPCHCTTLWLRYATISQYSYWDKLYRLNNKLVLMIHTSMKTQQLSQYPSLNSISIACYPDCIRQSTPRKLSEDIRLSIWLYSFQPLSLQWLIFNCIFLFKLFKSNILLSPINFRVLWPNYCDTSILMSEIFLNIYFKLSLHNQIPPL